jgi:hypothetical protein
MGKFKPEPKAKQVPYNGLNKVLCFTDPTMCFLIMIESNDPKIDTKLEPLTSFGLRKRDADEFTITKSHEGDVEMCKHFKELDEAFTPMGRVMIHLGSLKLNPFSNDKNHFVYSNELFENDSKGRHFAKHIECVQQIIGEIGDIVGVSNPSYDIFRNKGQELLRIETIMTKNEHNYTMEAVITPLMEFELM